ncbi:putative ribonuclease H-like domain-containing protein [Tanacetum coccineum]|uniref:Ribonuclease H-like domain-containing protein n=1 Tax=Tanacetum coccineum TaxID=301880 RepID=A0ABQ5H4Y4_9ASTR
MFISDLQEETAPAGEQSGPPAPKISKQLTVKRNQERAAIKSRFGGNNESKKMQRNVLKHQFENFTTTPNESLDKAYDMFQKLISQLEVHVALVSKEDINQKFLRSLPASWSQIALIMRNKPDIDQTNIDDLYNNLMVYEDKMKRSLSSTSNSQNLAFLFSENTSNTNEVSTVSGDFGVNTAGGTSSTNQVSSTPCADEVVCSFFAQQTTSPPLDNEDLQQIDQVDLEELDIRWQVAMLTVRVQRFIQKIGWNLDFKGKQHVTFDKSKVECYNCHRKGHFAKECKLGRNQGKRSYGDNGRRNATTNKPSSQALVAQDGLGGYDWSNDFDEPVNYALMAISSSSSSISSDNEVQNCSKKCLESFKTLQKNYDIKREKHSRARLEIQGYELALESLESRILGHEKNELAWGEKYEFQNYELKCREIKINNLKMELEKVVKERDELKVKIEKWEESSKGLNKILNSQMSAKDKNGLGYGTQLDELSNKSETDSEISMSVFEVRSSDEEITPANDRFSKADGYHAVPPPITGNFLTPRADISFAGLDEYAIRKKIIESKTTELNTDTSKSKTSETVGKTNEVNIEKPKSVHESVVPKPKINRDKVIIEDWYSDDEDDVSEVNTVSPVKTNETQTVKTQVDKIGQISQKEGIGFKKIKACFVCKSTDHLIKDCDFYAKKSPEPKLKTVVNTGQRVVKPVWDNAKRVNHQIKRSYYTKPAFRPKNLKKDVKTSRVKNMTTAGTRAVVNTGKGKMDNDLKKSRWVWWPKENYMDHESKEKGSFILKKFEYVDPKGISKSMDHAVVDSGCSSHMTGNKAYLSDYEDYNGGFVAFGSDPKGGKPPSISFMRPFGCPLTILNTLDPLGKFDGKSDEGYLLGYSTTSKAFRVYNKRTKRVEENMHINFLKDQPNMAGSGPDWIFDLDCLTNTMNYIPVSVENQVNVDAGTQEHYVAGSSEKDKEPTQEYILLPLHPHRPRISVEDVVQAAQEKPSENSPKDNDVQDSEDVAEKEEQHTLTEAEQALKDDLERMIAQEIAAKAIDDATRQAFEEEKKRAAQATSINKLNTGRPSVSTSNSPLVSTANTPYASAASTPTGANTGGSSFVYLGGQIPIDASTLPNADLPIDPNMPDLEDDSNVFPNDGIFSGAYDDEDVGAEADFNNMDNTIDVSPIPTLRVHKDHPKGQILGDPKSAVQTRGKIQKASSVQQALVSYIYNQNRTNHKDHQNCLLACFLSQEEPKTISQALEDESWVEAMQEELLQFKLQKVWILVDLPFGKKAIGTKWVFRNKRDERSIVVKNKARLVAQGFRQEEGIDYDEVFAPIARIEAIRLFLAFASFMRFLVYQMDVKSAFLYDTSGEEVYVHQPLGFVDQDIEVPQPQGPTITLVADEATTTSVGVETKGAATTTSGLDAGMYSGNIHESPLKSHEAPLLEGNTSGSAEDSWQLKELMAIVPKMVTKIDSLEKELKETKQTLGNDVLTLVKKAKSLEVALKRMSKRVILSDSEDEETENQGRKIQDIDDDPLVSLVRESMKEKEADFITHTKASASGEVQEEGISPTILEAAQILSQVVSQSVSTYKRRAMSANKGKEIGTGLDFFSAAKERLNSAEVEVNTKVNPGSAGVNTGNTPVSTPSVVQIVNVTIPSPIKDQREGKALITAEDVQATQKIKAQIEQEKARLAEAMRLQALQDEKAARQVHLDALLAKRIQEEQELSEQQQKRKAGVQEAAQYYTEEDWDTIRAKLKANAELTKSLQGENCV